MKDQKKATSRKKVYICSPFRPVLTDPILRANEVIDNLKLAKDACTFATLRGCEPIAPHLFYPQFLNDDDEYERALGMELGIKSRTDWEFAGMFADEGVSGCSIKGRQGFQAMIEEALNGGINLIITKSVSRFARNTVDSLSTIRKLKEHNVECYFEKENIWTSDLKRVSKRAGRIL